MRPEYDGTSARELGLRTMALIRLAAKLKWISDIFGVAVIVVNHVSSKEEEEEEIV